LSQHALEKLGAEDHISEDLRSHEYVRPD
jgi:hypothetical protein